MVKTSKHFMFYEGTDDVETPTPNTKKLKIYLAPKYLMIQKETILYFNQT